MKSVVKSEHNGVPLRTYLRGTLRISGGILTGLKAEPDGILVNGCRETVRFVLHTGDTVELNFPEDEQSDIEPVELPFDILYEDEDVLAVNKPSGMPTHPSHGHRLDTLANAAAYHYKEKPFVFRAVNRLDRDTSGIVLLAKNRLSASLLFEQMKAGGIKKTYYALCRGIPPSETGIIDKNIKREKDSIIFRRVCPPDEGRTATTIYKSITLYKHPQGIISLVELKPLTGRTHQLRVHTASEGFPILCDGLYGDGFDGGLSRLALHASGLSFTHPATGALIEISAPLPEEWMAECEKWIVEEIKWQR